MEPHGTLSLAEPSWDWQHVHPEELGEVTQGADGVVSFSVHPDHPGSYKVAVDYTVTSAKDDAFYVA